MTNILGIIKDYSDPSACLLINGKLVGAVVEERLGKKIKHESSFQINSIKWLIKSNNLKYSDINYIAVSNDLIANFIPKLLYSFDFSSFNLIKKIKSKFYNKSSLKKKIIDLWNTNLKCIMVLS